MEGIEILKNKLFIFMILSLMLISLSAVCAEDTASLNLNETDTATTNSVSCQNNEVELVENTLSKNDMDFNNLTMSNAKEITNEPNTGDKIYVNPINGDDNNNGSNWDNSVKTINKALTLVNDNGFIYLGNGEHTTPATINKNVKLIGQNQEKTILTNSNNCFLTITSNNVEIYNTTFKDNKRAIAINGKNGKYYINNCSFINNKATEYGGAIMIGYGTLTILNSNFINNTALDYGDGGAICIYDGTLNISNSTFINNNATNTGGAIYIQYGTLNISNSTFINNTANIGGAVCIYDGTLTTNNSTFTNNTANTAAGAIYMYSGTLTTNNSTFTKNTATNDGGAIYMYSGTLTTNNSTFTKNIAQYGGVISIDTGNITTNNSTFTNNTATSGGGDIYMSNGNITTNNSTFTNNTASVGGSIYIYNNGKLTINNSIFKNNKADSGTIYMNNGTLIVNDSIFIKNTANNIGGSIYMNNGNISIDNSIFIKNTDVAIWLYGHGDITIDNSNFINNTATYYGGAIYMDEGTFTITNSTFTNNTANRGGSIYMYDGNLTINNSVLVNNTADKGEAIYINNGKFIDVNGNWWGSNNPDWNSLISGTSVPNSFVVLDVSFNEINYNIYNVIANFYLNGTQTIANIPTRTVEFKCESEVITGKMINGTYNQTYIIDSCDEKDITVSVDNEIQNITLKGKKINTNITLNDIIMIYHDGTRLIAILTDNLGNPIANAKIYFTINGVTYNRTTDNNGNASMALNLNPGIYNASILFNGSDIYNKASKNITVTIKSTISGQNIVKFYQNGTQFFATFIDTQGNILANTNVTFNINGVFYTRKTNENGTARLAINLRPGEYILTAINPNSTEQKGFTITVKSLIKANDLIKYFQNASRFEAKIYNKDGSLATNTNVTFNINGVFYTRTTNNEGVVSLAINLRPGNYAITTMYEGLVMGNAVNVLPTLLTTDLEMVYHDGSKFQAKTLDGQGNPLANQTVTFNVNGVFYHKVTGDDGVASLNINLNPGEYIITSIWNNYQVGNKITIV